MRLSIDFGQWLECQARLTVFQHEQEHSRAVDMLHCEAMDFLFILGFFWLHVAEIRVALADKKRKLLERC